VRAERSGERSEGELSERERREHKEGVSFCGGSGRARGSEGERGGARPATRFNTFFLPPLTLQLAGKRAVDLLGRRKGEEVKILEDTNSFKLRKAPTAAEKSRSRSRSRSSGSNKVYELVEGAPDWLDEDNEKKMIMLEPDLQHKALEFYDSRKMLTCNISKSKDTIIGEVLQQMMILQDQINNEGAETDESEPEEEKQTYDLIRMPEWLGEENSGLMRFLPPGLQRGALDLYEQRERASKKKVMDKNNVMGEVIMSYLKRHRQTVKEEAMGFDYDRPMDEFDGAEKSGRVIWSGANELRVRSPEDMIKYISKGKSRRATESTDVNGTSSRSHAVLQITINEITLTKEGHEDKVAKGCLTMIDCAGSERRNDSLYHNIERQRESAEINASLYALKECIRARLENKNRTKRGGGDKYVPYRNSLLTKILRETFEVSLSLVGGAWGCGWCLGLGLWLVLGVGVGAWVRFGSVRFGSVRLGWVACRQKLLTHHHHTIIY